mgnify:CR=1 FL=1
MWGLKACGALIFLGGLVYFTSTLFWTVSLESFKPRGYRVNFICHPVWGGATMVIEGRRMIKVTCGMIEFNVDYDRTTLLLVKDGCDILYYDILQDVERSGEAYIGVHLDDFERVCSWRPATRTR